MGANLQTPFYRIRTRFLDYDIELLNGALKKNWGNYICGYSVKTNSLPWLLNYLRKNNFYAEVVSFEEYDLVRRIGFPIADIIYNGPIKDKDVFDEVLLGGGYVNLDSNYEIEYLKELTDNNPGREFNIGLRVNCDIAALCPDEELSEKDGGRFGYCYENGVLGEVIECLKAMGVKIKGLHLHASTKSRSVDVFAKLASMACKIKEEYNLSFDYVDMGGGYFGGDDRQPGYPQYFEAICRELRKSFSPENTCLIVEPGISLVSRCTTFETSVIDVKKIRGTDYVVTDGSRVNLNPLVTRHVFPNHIEYMNRMKRENVSTQWVCGATCMEYDRIFEIKDSDGLLPGDQIIYDMAGGYTMCLNPMFIHYLPPVYVEYEDGSIFMARDAWTNKEYMQLNYI